MGEVLLVRNSVHPSRRDHIILSCVFSMAYDWLIDSLKGFLFAPSLDDVRRRKVTDMSWVAVLNLQRGMAYVETLP